MNTQSNPAVAVEMAQAQAQAQAQDAKLDVYGRDAAERTVELNVHAAQAASELVDGNFASDAYESLKAEYDGESKPKTFDDAIGYIFYRGMSEIKRQWESAAKAKALKALEKKLSGYQELMSENPALIADANFVKNMMDALAKARRPAKL
jgi:hypothetical protein